MSARRRRWVGRLLGGAACVAGLSLLGWELYVGSAPFPIADLAPPPESLAIYDRHGELLGERVNPDGFRQRWTALAHISPEVARATVAVEDERFWEHDGVDDRALLRAAWQNLRAGGVRSGASTLTMQLVRLVHPYERRSMAAKLGQMAEARRLEAAADKATILEQYLNRAPYGAGAVGVEAASLRYFGKPSTALSLAEAALLAGLPQGPTVLNPFRNLERARARQRHVLDRMLATGAVAVDAFERAVNEPLRLVDQPAASQAPHVADLLAPSRPRGGDVHTTLDASFQARLQVLVARHVEAVRPRGITNAAALVLDNASCEVRAWIGSAGYFAGPDGAVNGPLARRQPGSTLKPFTYALALERGYSEASVLADIPTYYSAPRGSLFTPRNYDERHLGPVLLGEALTRSLNIPALELAEHLGVDDLLQRLRRLGFTSLEAEAAYYGLGLTLGNGEVTLLELAQAYAALARGGLACQARVVAETGPEAPERVFSEASAAEITHILSDPALRRSAMGLASPLNLGFPVALKTGTSSNWRDNWVVGYTAEHTVAVWAGDFGGAPLDRVSAAEGAGPLFAAILEALHDPRAGPSGRDWQRPPPGLERVHVCAHSGHRPGPHCGATREVWADPQALPLGTCPWHEAYAVDRRNGLLAGPGCPAGELEQRRRLQLPQRYAHWQALGEGPERGPRAYSPLCPAAGEGGSLAVTFPQPEEVFVLEPGVDAASQRLPLRALVDPPSATVEWRVDGRRVALAEWPHEAHWPLEPGRHAAEVVGPGGRRSAPVSFEVLAPEPDVPRLGGL